MDVKMEGSTKPNRIAAYLNKIQQGQQINYGVLVKLLERDGYTPSWIRKIFTAELIKRNSYRVQIVDEKAFDQLRDRYSSISYSDRSSAASAGDSHRSRVSGSVLLLRSIQHAHPQVVLCNSQGWTSPVALNEHALIVENMENFLAFQQTLNFSLEHCGLSAGISDVDLIFGQGNSITNALHQSFLAEYKSVNCLFDPDLGGVKMFSTLLAVTARKNYRFLLPDDIDVRLASSPRSLSPQERTDLSSYANRHPDLDRAIRLLRNAGRTLEQETYLQ